MAKDAKGHGVENGNYVIGSDGRTHRASDLASMKPARPVVARHANTKSAGTDSQQPRDNRGRFAGK